MVSAKVQLTASSRLPSLSRALRRGGLWRDDVAPDVRAAPYKNAPLNRSAQFQQPGLPLGLLHRHSASDN